MSKRDISSMVQRALGVLLRGEKGKLRKHERYIRELIRSDAKKRAEESFLLKDMKGKSKERIIKFLYDIFGTHDHLYEMEGVTWKRSERLWWLAWILGVCCAGAFATICVLLWKIYGG